MLFIIHVYLIICLWAYDNFVPTLLLKDDSLKANRSKTCVSLLSLMNPMLYLLSTTCTYACFIFFNTLEKSWMGTRLLKFRGIRLVITQSVVPVELESLPEDRSCLSAICYLRLCPLY